MFEYIAIGCRQRREDHLIVSCYSTACQEFAILERSEKIKRYLIAVDEECSTYKCYKKYFTRLYKNKNLLKYASLLQPTQTLICQR